MRHAVGSAWAALSSPSCMSLSAFCQGQRSWFRASPASQLYVPETSEFTVRHSTIEARRAARLSLPTPDHLTGIRRSSVSSKNRGPFYDDPIPGLYLDGCGRSAIASTRVWPRPNGREVVELILRDGPQAQAIRAESEVTRREQLARLAYPNPSIIYSRESAGFTEFLQAEQSLPIFGARDALSRAGFRGDGRSGSGP